MTDRPCAGSKLERVLVLLARRPPCPCAHPSPFPTAGSRSRGPATSKVGQVVPLQYFGQHLALWRDDNGVAHVNDAFCPHLGAHFGHGGSVDGEELICPFHGWRFDAEGQNTLIPYSERLNKKACVTLVPDRRAQRADHGVVPPRGCGPHVGGPRDPRVQRSRELHRDGHPRVHHRGAVAGARRERRGRCSLPLRAPHRRGARARVVRGRRPPHEDALDPEVPHTAGHRRRTHRRRLPRPRLLEDQVLRDRRDPAHGLQHPDRRDALPHAVQLHRAQARRRQRAQLQRRSGLRGRDPQAGPGGQADLGEQGPPGPTRPWPTPTARS